MNNFETVPSQNDRAHLAAATREPEVHAALLRHLAEVAASAAALAKWESQAVATCPVALPKQRSTSSATVSND